MGGSIMAVVINGTTGIDKVQDGSIGTADLAADAVTTAKIASSVNLGRRNIIINGEMNIAQRGTSLTGVTDNTFVADRWGMRNGGSAGFNAEQSTDAPTGHKNSLKITSTGAHTPGASNYIFVSQKIEHNNMWFLNYGTSDAVQQTLSFWVKSSKTGTHSVTLRNQAQSRSYGMTYTISSANTWEQKTLSWTSDTTGTWATGTSNGLEIMWNLGSGSSQTTTSNDVWLAGGYLKANGAVDIVDTNSATFQITGVQLEVGDTATPFEHRSFGDELAACQRYYRIFPSLDSTATYGTIGNGYAYDTNTFLLAIPLSVRMRSLPSVTSSGSLKVFTSGNPTNAITNVNTSDSSRTSLDVLYVDSDVGAATLTAREGGMVTRNNDSDAYLAFDAEL
jgi:hypothetical protein